MKLFLFTIPLQLFAVQAAHSDTTANAPSASNGKVDTRLRGSESRKLVAGEHCTAQHDCAWNEFCDLHPHTLSSNNGYQTCKAKRDAGIWCWGSAAGRDSWCLSHQCAAANSLCAVTSCTSQANCPSTHFCDLHPTTQNLGNGYQTCKPKRPDGVWCWYDSSTDGANSWCEDGHICETNSYCKTLGTAAIGYGCSANSDCSSGICKNGICGDNKAAGEQCASTFDFECNGGNSCILGHDGIYKCVAPGSLTFGDRCLDGNGNADSSLCGDYTTCPSGYSSCTCNPNVVQGAIQGLCPSDKYCSGYSCHAKKGWLGSCSSNVECYTSGCSFGACNMF